MKKAIIISSVFILFSIAIFSISIIIYKPVLIYNCNYNIEVKLTDQELNYYQKCIDEYAKPSDVGITPADYREYGIYKNHEAKLRCLYSKENVKIFVDEKSGGSTGYTVSIVEKNKWFVRPIQNSSFYIFVDDKITDDSALYDSDIFHEVNCKYWIWLYQEKEKTSPFSFIFN